MLQDLQEPVLVANDDNIVQAGLPGIDDNIPKADLPVNLEGIGQDLPPQHLHVGMTLIWMDTGSELLLENSRNAEATRLWSRFFCSNLPGNTPISIPQTWSNFFTVMLLSPGIFDWARNFLSSEALHHFQDLSGSVDFSIPAQCPNTDQNLCLPETVGEHESSDNGKGKAGEVAPAQKPATKGTPRKRGTQRDPPISENEVRRSERFKLKNNGFKSSTCSDRRCIYCCPSPPIMSNKLIQNLGSHFCKMDPDELSEEALSKNKRKATIIGTKETGKEKLGAREKPEGNIREAEGGQGSDMVEDHNVGNQDARKEGVNLDV